LTHSLKAVGFKPTSLLVSKRAASKYNLRRYDADLVFAFPRNTVVLKAQMASASDGRAVF
jgi:hypothetical protein